TITLTGNNSLSEFVLNNGTIGVGSDSALPSSTQSQLLTINGGTFANNSTAVRHVGTAPPGGSMRNTTNINADFSVDDSLNPTPGTIELNGYNYLNTNAKITVQGSASLLLQELRQNGSGRTLTKDGPGTLELRGYSYSDSFSGAVTVLAGRLQVDSTS